MPFKGYALNTRSQPVGHYPFGGFQMTPSQGFA